MTAMGNQKPLAALSSGLLARKGHAKPAMRPQGFGGFGAMPNTHDDLGWNDMGHDAPEAEVPPVVRQIEALQEEFAPVAEDVETSAVEPVATPVAVKPVSVATAARIDRETTTKRAKAAFTLRLEHDRHLRLRLASALCGRSAQALVTDAVDAYLQSLPEVEALVRQIPQGRKSR